MQRVRRTRPLLTASAAALTAGLALWFTRASLDVFSGPHGVTRVAMFRSWPELAGLTALVCLVALASLAGLERLRDGSHPQGASAFRSPDTLQIFLPLFSLGLLALPYLPVLPDRAPVLRVLAGPIRFWLWFIVIAQVVWVAISLNARGVARTGTPSRQSERRSGSFLRAARAARVSPVLVVFLASAVAFGAAAFRLIDRWRLPGGDEPHYLVITQSLLRDRDFKIENNHRRGDYSDYFQGTLDPHYLTRGADGQIYSVHPVGLPVLAAPAFALGGYRGVVLFLVCLAAAAAALMWRWAREITASAGAATFAWAAVCLGAPYFFNALTVYPEIPAAACVLMVLTDRGTGRSRAFPGLAIAALPWLSTKYAPMAGTLAAIVVWRVWHGPRESSSSMRQRAIQTATFLVLPAVSLVGWLAFFSMFWGSPWPTAPYGGYDQTNPLHLRTGAPGLLFDQEYGVLPYAPILILGFTGLIAMGRHGGVAARRAIEIALVVAALIGTVGTFRIWWGGSAAPGRPLASALLLLGIPIAWQYAQASDRPARRAAYQLLLLVGLSATVTLLVAQDGLLLANGRDGASELLEWLSPSWHLWAMVPSFIYHHPAIAGAHASVWLAAAWLVSWLTGGGRWSVRSPQPPVSPQPPALGRAALVTTLATASAVTLVSLIVPSLFGARVQPDVKLEARSRVSLLDRFDATARPLAIVYDPGRRIASRDVPPLMALTAVQGLRVAPQPIRVLFNARFSLPAGDYRVELRPANGRPRGTAGASASEGLVGTLALQVGRNGDPLRQWPIAAPEGQARTEEFSLPVDAAFVGFRASPTLEASTTELRLYPLRIVDAGVRIMRPPVLAASIYSGTVVFFHDDEAYPEPTGFWTRGRSTAEVTLAPAAPRSGESFVALRLHSGAVPNTVTLETADWAERLDLQPYVAREVRIPVASGAAIVSLRITTHEGFVPADLDATSGDRRYLGCWIEVAQPDP